MKGLQITNLFQLDRYVHERRAVVCENFGGGRALPATVLMNQQGRILLKAFQTGMWVYEKKDGPIVDAEFKPNTTKGSEEHEKE